MCHPAFTPERAAASDDFRDDMLREVGLEEMLGGPVSE
jgi:hypothetical protein